jgi:hypothetical protein
MKLIYLLLISYAALYSQDFEPEDFFPFHDGDIWEYYTRSSGIDRRELTRDSVSAEGHYLFYNDESLPRYLADSIYITSNPLATSILNKWKIYKLNADSGDTWINIEDSVESFRIFSIIKEIYMTILFDKITLVKKIDYYAQSYFDTTQIGGYVTTHYIAAGFGFIRQESEFSIDYSISGAKIDGEIFGTLTPIEKPKIIFPTHITLHQNYPNPFNLTTTIKTELSKNSDLEIGVINILGQIVAILANGNFKVGSHEFNFNASDLASGIYFYYLRSGNTLLQRKMSLIK